MCRKIKMDIDFAGPNSVSVTFELYKLGQVALLSEPQFPPVSKEHGYNACKIALRIGEIAYTEHSLGALGQTS